MHPCRRNALYEIGPCSNWAVIADDRSKTEAGMLVNDLRRSAQGMGWQMASPREVRALPTSSAQTYVQAITDVK